MKKLHNNLTEGDIRQILFSFLPPDEAGEANQTVAIQTSGCFWEAKSLVIRLQAETWEIAALLGRNTRSLSQGAIRLYQVLGLNVVPELEICWGDISLPRYNPVRFSRHELVTANLSRSRSAPELPNLQDTQQVSEFLLRAKDSELYLLLSAADAEQLPIAITRNSDSKMLAANQLVSATHGRNIDDAIGESLSPLWPPEMLERAVLNPLEESGQILDTTYTCYKWSPKQKGGWGRTEQHLVGSFFAVSFLGADCRLSYKVRSAS